jgi:hypothetical protein
MKSALFMAAAAVLLSGCAHTLTNLEAQARIDPRTAAAYPNAGELSVGQNGCGPRRLRSDEHSIAINLDCFYFPESLQAITDPKTGEVKVLPPIPAYDLAAGSRIYRNRLAAVLVKHSDDVCTKELGDISAREAISNTVLGTITSTLSTVSSIVTGTKLKSWLAGGAAISSATRDHINAEVFRNVLSNAMAKAIENSRATQLTAIKTALKDNDVTDYTIDDAIRDINRYHQTCSFYNGLVLVVDAVNRAGPTIENDYRTLTTAISDLNIQIDQMKRDKASAELIAKLEAKKAALVLQRSELGLHGASDSSQKATNITENK